MFNYYYIYNINITFYGKHTVECDADINSNRNNNHYKHFYFVGNIIKKRI